MDAAGAEVRPATPDRRPARARHPDHRVPDRHHGSRHRRGRSAAATGGPIHHAATLRRHHRRPTRNPIRIGAAAAGVAVEVAVRGQAVPRIKAEVRAAVRGRAEVARARNSPE
ncbi:MAG: hypothetical protein M3Z28_11790 [Candidatus Dormibacteraeota bacterium]|nr:hypothetical protein [Candidatus Dormibacteraeota bacterium]